MIRKIVFSALILLSISGAAFAQTTAPTFCGTLSQADCAILSQSQQAMASLDSASFDTQIDLTVSNTPDLKAPISIHISGNGAYGGLNKLRSDLTAAATDPGQLLVALLTDLKADLTITIDLPPDTMTALGVQTRDGHITVQERLVDGFGYLNLDTLQSLMSNSRMHGWYGLDLASFLKSAMQQMPELFNNSMSNLGNSQAYQKDFSDPAFINRFLQIERTDDGSTSTATFEIVLDLGKLMGSPEFQTIMRQQMERQNSAMTSAEIDQALAASLQMFKGMDVTLSEDIDTDTGYLQAISGSFLFDASGMMASMGTSGGKATPAPQIKLDFVYRYSDFNDAPEISAPPNPVIIPYQSLLRASASA